MDSFKFNIFQHIILVSIFINSSLNLLTSDSGGRNRTTNQPEIDFELNSRKQQFFEFRMKARIKSFLKLRQQKPKYLVWVVFDLFLGFYLMFNMIIYGFGSETFISRLKEKIMFEDLFACYRFKRMINKVAGILLIETYLFRCKHIWRDMHMQKRHQHLDLSVTYLNCLKLTLRAWLYILGLTNGVHCKDKLHRRIAKCCAQDDTCGRRAIMSSAMKIDASGLDSLNSQLNKSKRINYKKELFVYDHDFREINYQLESPFPHLKNGSPHVMDMVTLRFSSYGVLVCTWTAFFTFSIALWYSLLCEIHKCHDSIILYFEHRFFSHLLMLISCIIILFQYQEISMFMIDCFIFYSKARHTRSFASQLIDRSHRKSARSCVTLSMHRRSLRNEGTIENYMPSRNNSTDREVRIYQYRCKSADTIADEDKANLVDLSKDMDRLISMIVALRSDFDQMRRHFTFDLNLGLVFKMPCVILTLSSLLTMADLKSLEDQLIHLVLLGYLTPILYITLIAGSIHSKVIIIRFF